MGLHLHINSLQHRYASLWSSFGAEICKNPKLSFKADKRHLAVASLSINLLSLALPIMTLQVYDRLLGGGNIGTLNVLIIGVCLMVILETFLRLARAYVIGWAGAVYEHTISCNAMRHSLAADMIHTQKSGTTRQLQRINHITRLRDIYSGQAIITMMDIPFVVVFLVLVGWLGGGLVFVPIALLTIFIALAFHIGQDLRNVIKLRDQADERRISHIIETLEGIHMVKAFGIEPFFQRHYEAYQRDASTQSYHLARLSGKAQNYGILFTQLMTVSVIAAGSLLVMQGTMTLGALIACVLLSARMMQPVQRAMRLWAGYQDFQLAMDNVREIFEMPSIERLDPKDLGACLGELEISNLSFSYSPDAPPILKDVNLSVKSGEVIAITGERSCGKTTLLKLISGLYQPNQGEVLVDGSSAVHYPARELICHVGFLPMDGIIFRGTIWDNISSFGEHSDQKVTSVIELLELDREISKLPAGYDTFLEGTQSDAVPSGVRQRIAIARALATHPRMILFDNADQALDKEGYNQVYRLLGRLKGKASMILVTNDLNITRLADRNYILEDGCLHEGMSDKSSTAAQNIKPNQELRL